MRHQPFSAKAAHRRLPPAAKKNPEPRSRHHYMNQLFFVNSALISSPRFSVVISGQPLLRHDSCPYQPAAVLRSRVREPVFFPLRRQGVTRSQYSRMVLTGLADFTAHELPTKKWMRLIRPRLRLRVRVQHRDFVSSSVIIKVDERSVDGMSVSSVHWPWNGDGPFSR